MARNGSVGVLRRAHRRPRRDETSPPVWIATCAMVAERVAEGQIGPSRPPLMPEQPQFLVYVRFHVHRKLTSDQGLPANLYNRTPVHYLDMDSR